MFRIKQIMAIARAEGLITRRLARYWIFLVLACLISLFFFMQYSVIHGFLSSFSATVAMITPRFLLSMIGLYYLAIFIVGTVFLAFDIRARDKRERMAEVLDSRPYSNLELIIGRFLGLFIISWIPIVVLTVIYHLLGYILAGIGAPFGEPLDMLSMFSLVFIMAVPALSFSIAMVFFVTLLVRNRLVAAVVLLAFTGFIYWGMVWLPSVYGGLFDIFGLGSTFFTSEIVRRLAAPEGWMQRGSVLLAAFALLGFSAAVHPRLDGGSRMNLTVKSAVVLILAIFLSWAGFYRNISDLKIRETWKDAHAAVSYEIVPELKRIEGNVNISPGKEMLLDINMTFGAPEKGEMKRAVFTLNPGQEVKTVSDLSGKPVSFIHENGLLELELSQVLKAGEEKTVRLTIQGEPDDRFAYLFSSFNVIELSGRKSSNLPLLGLFPGVFDSSFIALMPGLRWLPASGPEKDRDDPALRPADFFYVDLTVDLPKGWLAAGPGRRHNLKDNHDRERFRFYPSAPVPEAALIASRFESRAMEVQGVTLEVLVNRRHTKNLEVLSDTEEKIREWVGDRLREAAEFGLDYPYDAITLVEVPNFLRIYGGGWRMDTVMAPPGILLMRETGFPIARFDTAFRKPDNFKDREGGIEQAKYERLKNFFVNDLSGGNILSGAARNFFLYQTSAEGPEGLALNYVMETLSDLLITENQGYFSAHGFIDSIGGDTLNTAAGSVITSAVTNPGNPVNIVNGIVTASVSRPEVWEKALGMSLVEIDPWEDPGGTVNVLTLKADAVARSILDTMGREKTGKFLASIREAHKGGTFSLHEFLAEAENLGYDLTGLLGDWLGTTGMPGFVSEAARIYRISDSQDGSPRYQMLFTIRNDEPVPGLFRIAHHYPGEAAVRTDPVAMKGKSTVRYGIVVSRPPEYVMLEPYLSLNRRSILLPLNTPDQESIENTEAVIGIEELQYLIPDGDYITVDDLDSGFSVTEDKETRGLRIMARQRAQRSLDQGLPVTNVNSFFFPRGWSRAVNVGSFGRYRHTLAVTRAGDGSKKALFSTDINRSGKWDLELFIPWKNNIWPNKKWGTYHLTVTDANGDEHEIRFDSNAASPGWNFAESFYLPEGEITVALSDKTDGEFVVADAVRWSPSAGTE